MAEIWKPHERIVYLRWIETIKDEASDELNEWEENFIDSVETQLDNGRNLSQSQAEKLEQIYTKLTK